MIYNLHNIIKFKIQDNRNIIEKKIDLLYNQYNYYKDVELSNDNVDFIINIGYFNPKNKDCFILDDRYYIKDNYFYCSDNRKLSKWKVEIEYLEGNTTIVNISVNFWGNISIISNFIDFLIHFKMTMKGYPMIHASGVLIENKGILFAARSGGGKTTIATHLMEKGFKYFGDNFVILNKNKIFNFLSPLNIFTYNITPLIKRQLSFNQKVSISIKNLIYILSGKYIKIFTKLNLFEILPKTIANSGELSTIIFLIPKGELSIKKISRTDAIGYLVYNQQIEFIHMPFLNYISVYSYIHPNSKVSTHWQIYEEALNNAIDKCTNIFRIEVPQKYDLSTVNEILRLVNDCEN